MTSVADFWTWANMATVTKYFICWVAFCAALISASPVETEWPVRENTEVTQALSGNAKGDLELSGSVGVAAKAEGQGNMEAEQESQGVLDEAATRERNLDIEEKSDDLTPPIMEGNTDDAGVEGDRLRSQHGRCGYGGFGGFGGVGGLGGLGLGGLGGTGGLGVGAGGLGGIGGVPLTPGVSGGISVGVSGARVSTSTRPSNNFLALQLAALGYPYAYYVG